MPLYRDRPRRNRSSLAVAMAALIALAFAPAAAGDEAAALYGKHCAACHGAERLGGTGPALLPENLGRLKQGEAVEVILHGRPATQMPGHADKLTPAQAQSLAKLIYTAPAAVPAWGLKEIEASRVVHNAPGSLPGKPVFKADPLNLFVVVETGDHHATLLDGDRFEPVARFATRYALHGGPKFSPDGRYVYFGSRDGWVSKYDIYNLKWIAEARAGINMRNIAVSADGRYVMAGNYLPHTLVIFDAVDLKPLKLIAVKDDAGKSSRVSAVYDAGPRKSFIAALKDITEVWEIPYADDHEPIYPGYVHDYKMGEAIAEQGPFPVRRIKLDDYLDDFSFDPGYKNVIGAARNARNGQVVSLIVGRKIADVDLTGLPHLGSGISWDYQGRTVIATPNLKESTVSVIDTGDWKTVARIATDGPGFFMRSHENSAYAWVDVFFGPHKDVLHVIDKRTLKIARTLRPEPGKTAAHVEFTRDGRYALVSLWEMDGAIIVYDARTLKEVKRIPMKKPSGKYNIYNKITRSSGTSH